MTAVLYILMRNDIASMNCGKAMAQASHASNAFVHHYHEYAQKCNAASVLTSIQEASMIGFSVWENDTTQGFGTVLVLEGRMRDFRWTIDNFKQSDYIAGIVHDPTYPIVDGDVVHHFPLDTCAYVFVPDKENDTFAARLLEGYQLHQ